MLGRIGRKGESCGEETNRIVHAIGITAGLSDFFHWKESSEHTSIY